MPRPTRRPDGVRLLAVVTLLALAGAGCGQKGPLYVPGPDGTTIPSTAPLPEPVPEDDRP